MAHNASAAAIDTPNRPNGDHAQSNEHGLTSSNAAQSAPIENGEGQVALAAVPLHQNTRKPVPVSTEVQCHKCHWKKVRIEPSPYPPLPQRESSRPPVVVPSVISVPTPDADMVMPQYAWPLPPS